MRNRLRLHANLLSIVLGLVFVLRSHQVNAAAPCTDLPPSRLLVYDIKAHALDEVEVPAAELAGGAAADDFASRHTLMLTVSNVVTLFEVTHHMVPRDDGMVCDSPSLVRMGFGSSQRRVFLARAAAEDACVRGEMLRHEAAHTLVLNDVVDRFIDQHASDFRLGLAALKETPAASPEIAIARWVSGLQAVTTESKRKLLDEIRSASTHVDQPSALAALEDACGGKIRQLEDRRD